MIRILQICCHRHRNGDTSTHRNHCMVDVLFATAQVGVGFEQRQTTAGTGKCCDIGRRIHQRLARLANEVALREIDAVVLEQSGVEEKPPVRWFAASCRLPDSAQIWRR